jgi:multidrug efflux pump subunit AcrA (membrane-fusion protein)
MVQKGADAQEDLETAQTAINLRSPTRMPLSSSSAVEDSVKAAQAQLSVAKSLVSANEAQVKQCTAALQSAQLDLEHTSIKAPVGGVVCLEMSMSARPSRQAFRLKRCSIAQDLTVQVDTNVSEADVGRVRLIGSDLHRGRLPRTDLQRNVTSVRKAPINVQNVSHMTPSLAFNQDLKLFRYDGKRQNPCGSTSKCREGF